MKKSKVEVSGVDVDKLPMVCIEFPNGFVAYFKGSTGNLANLIDVISNGLIPYKIDNKEV